MLPVLWSDNYITLLPGEKREIEAVYSNGDGIDFKPELKLKGWNLI